MKRTAALVVLFAACHSTTHAPPMKTAEQPSSSAFTVDGVATWRGDATAAYSIIHDDVCDPGALGVFSTADPELTRRGLHAGFGVVAGACDAPRGGRWDQVKTLVAHGHDVFSHSWDHPCMTHDAALATSCDAAAPRSTDFAKEIGRAATTLQSVTGLAQTFFIFPYDVCDPAAVSYLKQHGYLSARCGALGTNAAAFADPFIINYDVFGPSYSNYFGSAACAKTANGASPVQYTTLPGEYTGDCRLYILNHYVDDAISAHGWGVRELHGLDPVDPRGWETVPVSDYRAHLDYVAAKAAAGALWVEGPTSVIKYRFAREPNVCAPPSVIGRNTLRFPAPSADCQKYATVLSYRVSTLDGTDPTDLAVRQGDRLFPARRISAGHFIVDANPTRGDAVLVQSSLLRSLGTFTNIL
jgi:peptidoglycan/xylan/chitin deacetylase (PgdA/CDA1 family)